MSTDETTLVFRPITDHELIREHLLAAFTVDHLLVMGRPYPIRELTVTGAYLDDALVGLAFWTIKGQAALLAAVISLARHRGVARALVDEVAAQARAEGAKRLRAMTTNDNLEALRFYQLYGFRLTALFVNAIDMLRALHPSLAREGMNGIARRDSLELEMDL
jgi:ribosomal protein S18 acetylase RimI-like enzyme